MAVPCLAASSQKCDMESKLVGSLLCGMRWQALDSVAACQAITCRGSGGGGAAAAAVSVSHGPAFLKVFFRKCSTSNYVAILPEDRQQDLDELLPGCCWDQSCLRSHRISKLRLQICRHHPDFSLQELCGLCGLDGQGLGSNVVGDVGAVTIQARSCGSPSWARQGLSRRFVRLAPYVHPLSARDFVDRRGNVLT